MVGATISHYRVLEEIGQGGMGVVYRAQDMNLGRIVALKALPAAACSDPLRRRRFEQEARAAAALNHAAIATVYELENDGENIYIVMEFVEGESLRAVLRRPPLPLSSQLSIATQILQGLVSAHAHGIVHRDLKPENILKTPSGGIKILDFGLSRILPSAEFPTESLNLTSPGMVVGTLAYMSPEQLDGKETDARTDIFAFGVMLYELASGVHPFAGSSAASTIANVISHEPLPLAQVNSALPAQLGQIVWKCLRKDREQRYSSAAELLVDLERLQREPAEYRGHMPEQRSAYVARNEDTLLRRWFSSSDLTPRRWWEINQMLCLAAYPAVGYLGWRLRAWLPAGWEASFVSLIVVLAAITTTMRLYLLLTSLFDPQSLAAQVQRWRTIVLTITASIWVVLAIMAATFSHQHSGVGALVSGLAIGGFISTAMAETFIERRAFPQKR